MSYQMTRQIAARTLMSRCASPIQPIRLKFELKSGMKNYKRACSGSHFPSQLVELGVQFQRISSRIPYGSVVEYTPNFSFLG